ncbi:hypothetical protein N7539_007483 [Penicillium diatomitis]|uniref:C2 NT-type domain-containing protein n=1 Tax=Penicillium diatomitis TaxID=2819901 RepID=A0A9W9WV61_9EURO|nr:uncharacterized protein N7539_007483 [Penicillium diatomitis]KAJ5477339.1 hypothetical protein N7539_007483 [Penicillium diatomitis]
MQAFVPKNRRPRFELVLRIIDINNVPLRNSAVWIRWRLPSSSATEHQGHTEKASLLDHRASWNYEKTLNVRLTIDRNLMLQECDINFEIIQEFHGSPVNEKHILGKIKLNLAEYVDKVDEDEGVIRRYLMSDCKINSTVKIGIAMRQVEGDRNFTTPPLKSATVFGGIARVVHMSEPGDSEELVHVPAIATRSREAADMQDMYRRTLAASWNSRAWDLPADKLVEELFAGNSCWNNTSHDHPNDGFSDSLSESLTVEAARQQSRSGNRLSPSYEKQPKSASSGSNSTARLASTSNSGHSHPQKGGSLEQQLHENAKGRGWKSRQAEHELSEFDVREDLRSWEIRAERQE